MPTRPKTHRPLGWKPRDEKARQAAYDQQRESRSKRGYTRAWYASIRPAAIHRAGFKCEMCGILVVLRKAEATPYTPCAEVDHIDGNSRNNDPANLRCLCKPCHTQKTNREQGAGFIRPSMRPKWLKPSACKVVLVCGAAGSGKTTYVRSKAQPKDIIIDLDEIRSRLTGKPWYQWQDTEGLDDAIAERNRMLGRLHRAPAHITAWLIIQEPMVTDRRWWRRTLGNVDVHVIETPPEVCIRRIEVDSRRAKQDFWPDVVVRWWSRYSSDPDDVVVR